MHSIFTLKLSSPFSPDISSMIDALDRYQATLYPSESNHLDSRETLSSPNCRLFGAYFENQLVGIGSVKKFENYGELKRFYVLESFRGQGISELLVAALEYWLSSNSINLSYLETGIHQNTALKFYENLGYERTEPFGSYRTDPLSVFMKKNLASSEIIPKKESDPFYIVSFSSQLRPGTNYHEVAEKMVQLVKTQPGYLGMNSIRNEKGRGFTASYWKDLESIANWQKHPAHIEAKRLGKEKFYSSYKTTIALINTIP